MHSASYALKLDAMQQLWNKVTAREAKLEADRGQRRTPRGLTRLCNARSNRKAEAYLKFSRVLACHDE